MHGVAWFIVRFVGGAAGVVLVLSPTLTSSAETLPPPLHGITIIGRGHGHGVGLSQWGAEERAAAGESVTQILGFYYPGATIGRTADTVVRILVAVERRLTVGSSAAFIVSGADGRTILFAAGHQVVSSDGRFGNYQLELPLRISPGKAPLAIGKSRYDGTLTLSRVGGRIQAVNTIDLERYVGEVVSFENPAFWPKAALQAQAIASRSYALANLHPAASFDLYSDDRSQNYAGLQKHYASAVVATTATTGEVLRYRGQIVEAFFSASNGGYTRDPLGVLRSPERPYLVTRLDPFDAHSPDSEWGPVQVRIARLRLAFPTLPGRVVRIRATGARGRAPEITFVVAGGAKVRVGGPTFADRLGLRSPYFTLVQY